MAIFTAGPAVGSISGTIGSVNFANPSGSMVARTARRSSPNASEAQSEAQGRIQTVSNAWKALDEREKTAWRSYALLRNRSNRLGVLRKLTGYQEFMKRNLRLLGGGQTVESLPFYEVEASNIFNLELHSDAVQGVTIEFDGGSPLGSGYAFVYGRNLYRDTIPSFNNSWRFIGVFFDAGGEWDVTTEWTAKLGAPIENQVIACRVVPSSTTDYVPVTPVDMFAVTTP